MTTPTPEQRTALARFATVRPRGTTGDELPLNLAEELRQALVPASDVTRHNRRWRFGQFRDVEGRPGVLAGQIGYIDARETTLWDEEEQDFAVGSVPDGTSFPFVLDLQRGLLGYQAAKSSGVLSALQALLNSAGRGEWRVQRILNEQTWSTWSSSVVRVTRLTFTVHLPNPNWVGRDRLEKLMEDSKAGLARIVLQAEPDSLEGLDVQSEWVQQLVEHTEEKGYGTLKADGEAVIAGQDTERRYDGAARGAEELRELPVAVTGSIASETLSDALATVDEDPLAETVDDDEAQP